MERGLNTFLMGFTLMMTSMPAKLLRLFLGFIFLALFIWAAPVSAVEEGADQIMLDDDVEIDSLYILQISGHVYKETFAGARGLLHIQTSSEFDNNPYQIIIEGYPKQNSRNVFYWHSAGSRMVSTSNAITCVIRNSVVNPPEIFFYLLSPSLYETPGIFLTQHDEERRQTAIKTALPTRVMAQAGELKLELSTQNLTGSVWIRGYDNIEKSYVIYRANIFGTRAKNLEPKREKKD